jgi:hypothetical protein
MPLWLVLLHWYGLLLIALFELLHAGDGWLTALPWSHWPQALAAGWRSGQLSAGALFLLYLNVLMLVSAVLLLYVLVRVLAANRSHEAAPPATENLQHTSAMHPTAQAARGEAGDGLLQKPEVVALVIHFREQLKKIAGAGHSRRQR